MALLAIDPGTRDLGWARFDKDRHLWSCGLLRANGVEQMIDQTQRTFGRLLSPEWLIIEVPQAYGVGAKVDPNKLALLTLLAGVLIGTMPDAKWKTPKPREWKGQVPKEVMNTRTLNALTPAEHTRMIHHLQDVPKSVRHNVWDAIGIGLWASKRL